MYAGELEKHINENNYGIAGYDAFLGVFKSNKEKKTLSAQALAAKRQRRNESLKKLEEKVKSYGGIEGIGQSISNVATLFKGNSNQSGSGGQSAGYNISLGDSGEPKQNNYKPLIILGAVLAGVGIIWLVAGRSGKGSSTITNPA